MAVQQTRKTRSRRDMRRSHDALKHTAAVCVDPTSGELHRRHHLTKDGYYKGREVLVTAPETEEESK